MSMTENRFYKMTFRMSVESRAGKVLLWRTLSALVLMSVSILAIYLGGSIFALLATGVCAVLLYEWMRMIDGEVFFPGFCLMMSACGGSMLFVPAHAYGTAFILCGMAACLVWGLALRSGRSGFWHAFAALYIVVPFLALVWLRLYADNGMALTFFLFFIVWATDSGSFLAGKLIGGAKISTSVSPSKTWSGVAGGITCACVTGFFSGMYFFPGSNVLVLFLVSGLLGCVAVVGDLAESGIKRHFGIKDVSGFIPGHGGFMDRVDGLILVIMVATGAMYISMIFDFNIG